MAVVVIVKASFFIEVLAGIYSDARCPLKSTFFWGVQEACCVSKSWFYC
ncbi:hypothetical protein D1BOALGB6SA_10732, partial [Olavius sp. associated proteobacterium Delta 1]